MSNGTSRGSPSGGSIWMTLLDKRLTWVLGQGPSTVMLGAILVSIYFLSKYSIEKAIHEHLKSIQDVYKEQAVENK